MRIEVDIKPDMLTWAIKRAGYSLQEVIQKNPSIILWLEGKKKPTIKQLEDFSKKVYLPFGYFFLPEPPEEKQIIPFYRTNKSKHPHVNLNIYDTILLLEQRQEWLKEYLKEDGFEPLRFVGKYKNKTNVEEIVRDIRKSLDLHNHWASQCQTWEDTLDKLTEKIEDIGIIVTFNGVVENNTHRPIPVDECRGFVLVDRYAPFMFVNNSDSKAAQLFTIVHELAHIWTGHSAAFDYENLIPADDPIEILCDKIAAEFLVPADTFNEVWAMKPDIKHSSRYFKVSEIVIARRALDTGKISRKTFFDFYNDYINREYTKRENRPPGGDFYATTKKRLSPTFAIHINNAVKTGKLLYRDAYKLTSLNGNTFDNFFNKKLQ